MKAERARLVRLNRLERIRAIAKQDAALEAAKAESTLSRLQALADRTAQLAGEYAGHGGASDGWSLRQRRSFSGSLQRVHETTLSDAARARDLADGKMIELARAERRRAAVEDRAGRQASDIARGSQQPVLAARRTVGTDRE